MLLTYPISITISSQNLAPMPFLSDEEASSGERAHRTFRNSIFCHFISCADNYKLLLTMFDRSYIRLVVCTNSLWLLPERYWFSSSSSSLFFSIPTIAAYCCVCPLRFGEKLRAMRLLGPDLSWRLCSEFSYLALFSVLSTRSLIRSAVG